MSLLEFKCLDYEFSDDLNEAFMRLRGLWETPDDWLIADKFSLWRHARALACGYYYRYNPRPPKHWVYAHRAWASYVRQVTHNERFDLDTEDQVAGACMDGRLTPNIYNAWQQVKPDYEPSTEAIWLDNTALDLAQEWLMTHDGIVWVEDVALGKMLSSHTGVRFIGAETDLGQASGPVIACVEDHGEGPNLIQWHENLVMSCPEDGWTWQQLISRTHHPEQVADTVTFDILQACQEQAHSLRQAIIDAQYIQEATRQPQKLTGENKWIAVFQE